MFYAICSFRYVNDMTILDFKFTPEEAGKEIDRLAKEEAAKTGWRKLLSGDTIHFTYLPMGDPR